MKSNQVLFATMFLLAIVFVACQKDDDPANGNQQGRLIIELTDAPVDDA